jgi:hypothetical protein
VNEKRISKRRTWTWVKITLWTVQYIRKQKLNLGMNKKQKKRSFTIQGRKENRVRVNQLKTVWMRSELQREGLERESTTF